MLITLVYKYRLLLFPSWGVDLVVFIPGGVTIVATTSIIQRFSYTVRTGGGQATTTVDSHFLGNRSRPKPTATQMRGPVMRDGKRACRRAAGYTEMPWTTD